MPNHPSVATGGDGIHGDQELSAGLKFLEMNKQIQRFNRAARKILMDSGLNDDWMPILASVKSTRSGAYEIKFINLKDHSPRSTNIYDPAIHEFKDFLDKTPGTAGRIFNDVLHMPGVSATVSTPSPNLVMAVKVHDFVSKALYVTPLVGHTAEVINSTKEALTVVSATKLTVEDISGALGHAVAEEGLGVVFGGVNIVLDAYQFLHAESAPARALYATQLVFDYASFSVGLTGVGLGILGASTAAAVLGGASVIIGGLAVGAAALAEAFTKKAEGAHRVGAYFAALGTAYGDGGFKYNPENKLLEPLPGAVVSLIDMSTGKVRLGSQYVYKAHETPNTIPSASKSKSEVINIREAINKSEYANLDSFNTCEALVLPATPKAYITYSHDTLPFCLCRGDPGFDVLRLLGKTKGFVYDFYMFPTEYTICSMGIEYEATVVKVSLGSKPVRLVIPLMQSEIQEFMSYEVAGGGADYTISMNMVSKFTLSTTDRGKGKTRWILDCRAPPKRQIGLASKFIRDIAAQLAKREAMKEDTVVTVGTNSLTVSGITVTLEDRDFHEIIVITKKGEYLKYDKDLKKTIVSEDGMNFPGGNEFLLRHLRDLYTHHEIQGTLPIENYCPDDNQRQNCGRAYYDCKRDLVHFTNYPNQDLTKNAELGGIIGEDAYFYNKQHCALWRVKSGTGACLEKYYPFKGEVYKLESVWREGTRIMATYYYEYIGGNNWFTYSVSKNSMRLVSVVTAAAFVRSIDSRGKKCAYEGFNDWVGKSSAKPVFASMPGTPVDAVIDPEIVRIYAHTNGTTYYYWFRKGDCDMIEAHVPPFRTPKQHCLDITSPRLVFAGSVKSTTDQEEIFYFYCRRRKKLYTQVGDKYIKYESDVPEELSYLYDFQNIAGRLYTITNAGYILEICQEGKLALRGVNRTWLSSHKSSVWLELKAIAQKYEGSFVTVYDVKNSKGIAVPVWYHNGTIIIAAGEFHGQKVDFVGHDMGANEAWICRWDGQHKGYLYRQALVKEGDLPKVLGSGMDSIELDQIPKAEPVLEGIALKKITFATQNPECTMTDGVILTLSTERAGILVGVDNTWVESNSRNKSSAMESLIRQWHHSDVITVRGHKPTWYHVKSKRFIELNGRGWVDLPVWLGTDGSHGESYFYLKAHGKICSDTGYALDRLGPFDRVKRFGKTLVFVGAVSLTSGEDSSSPVYAQAVSAIDLSSVECTPLTHLAVDNPNILSAQALNSDINVYSALNTPLIHSAEYNSNFQSTSALHSGMDLNSVLSVPLIYPVKDNLSSGSIPTLHSVEGGYDNGLLLNKHVEFVESNRIHSAKSTSFLSVPVIPGIESVMMAGGDGNFTYNITQETWDNYKSFTIFDTNDSNATRVVRLAVSHSHDLEVLKVDDDLLLRDNDSHQSLKICKAFGHPGCREMVIDTQGKRVTIAAIEEAYLLKKSMNPGGTPALTLGSIV